MTKPTTRNDWQPALRLAIGRRLLEVLAFDFVVTANDWGSRRTNHREAFGTPASRRCGNAGRSHTAGNPRWAACARDSPTCAGSVCI
jgi:hypothetical protein